MCRTVLFCIVLSWKLYSVATIRAHMCSGIYSVLWRTPSSQWAVALHLYNTRTAALSLNNIYLMNISIWQRFSPATEALGLYYLLACLVITSTFISQPVIILWEKLQRTAVARDLHSSNHNVTITACCQQMSFVLFCFVLQDFLPVYPSSF